MVDIDHYLFPADTYGFCLTYHLDIMEWLQERVGKLLSEEPDWVHGKFGCIGDGWEIKLMPSDRKSYNFHHNHSPGYTWHVVIHDQPTEVMFKLMWP
jgi:hypothetical protein